MCIILDRRTNFEYFYCKEKKSNIDKNRLNKLLIYSFEIA